MKEQLEICCDASIKTFSDGRSFGCAGAIVIGLDITRTEILADTTNNKSELVAMYLAVKLAHEMLIINPNYDITIYADSQYCVYGLTRWMGKWIQTIDNNGIMYNSSNEPVKNQELFMMILSYMISNNLKLKIRHIKGHVKFYREKGLAIAGKVFYESNGYRLDNNTLTRLSLYNDKIDNLTRDILGTINHNEYEMHIQDDNLINICRYIVPYDYEKYIL